MQPGDGLKSVTFYTEDEQAYREQIWKLDTKVNDGWNLAQVKISRDYDFMIFGGSFFTPAPQCTTFTF